MVLESEVTVTPGSSGSVYASRTERGSEKMTLTLRFDRSGALTSAEALRETTAKRRAILTVQGKTGQLKRNGTTDFFSDLPANPIVTTAPDWSDIFQLVRRYDARKGGKQEFPGLWIHPVQDLQRLTFTIERLEKSDTVTVKDAQTQKDVEVKLDRYRIRLRSGDYLAWADGNARVVRLMPLAARALPVVLEGFEAATRSLGP
jgi:hypothetical protein